MQSWNRSALYDVAKDGRETLGKSTGTFFLTLCSVPAPISLPEPKSPTMLRYRFFFSKEQETGVDRCWLHFGYFHTMEEAAKWRDVLHRVYPAAAIHTIPRNDGIPPGAAASDNLSESQVLTLLTKGAAAGKPATPTSESVPGPRKATLEDTLNELRDSAWRNFDVDNDETSATGVRHLRVEVQAKPRASIARLEKARKKP